MPARNEQDLTHRAAFSLASDAAVVGAVRALSSAGVRPILLKGQSITHWLGGERYSRDVDLLVREDLVEEAVRALGALGYADFVDSEVDRARLSAAHARTLVPRAGSELARAKPFPVDLHWTFRGVGAPPSRFWAAVADSANSIEIFGTQVEIPSRATAALILALHAAAPRPGRPQPGRDLERAVLVFGPAVWADAATLAAALDASGRFAAGLHSDPRGTVIAQELGLPEIFDLETTLLGARAPGMTHRLQRLSESRGARARATELGRALVPSPAYMRIASPLASRGKLGLLAAYAWRPIALVSRFPRASLALLRARRRAEKPLHVPSRR